MSRADVFVFLGPTIPAAEAQGVLDATFLPPVAEGDLYKVAQRRPNIIAIVDGYFEQVPSVWHKEILWAMNEGVHVFGAASMGALRAAELAPFGMEGVGKVFAAFRDGGLEDDDEVAVAHAAGDEGYRALSEAMVNVRLTVRAAERAGVVSATSAQTIVGEAKKLFYPDRTYSSIIRMADAAGVRTAEVEGFRCWLPQGRLDQKRDDAIAMLRLIRDRMAHGIEPKAVSYSFEHSASWDAARSRHVWSEADTSSPESSVTLRKLLDEVGLMKSRYRVVHRLALLRLLLREESRRLGFVPSAAVMKQATDQFRREQDLLLSSDVKRWQEENVLDRAGFLRLMEDEARLRWLSESVRRQVQGVLPEELKALGEHMPLLERALDKQRVLEALGLHKPGLADFGMTDQDLFDWYFGRRVRCRVPRDVGSYARANGFFDLAAFRLAVLREWCYVMADEGFPAAPPDASTQ